MKKTICQRIRPGYRVTFLDHGQERTGKAMMPSAYGGWVLNMGGQHGMPGLCDESTIVAVPKLKYKKVEGKMTTNDLANLVKLVTTTRIGYNYGAKQKFARLAKKVLHEIAKCLGLVEDQYRVSFNAGGMAVSGEATLHAEGVYIQFAQSNYAIGGERFMYRSCKSLKDYSGGPNRWMAWRDLLDLDAAVEEFREAMQPAFVVED